MGGWPGRWFWSWRWSWRLRWDECTKWCMDWRPWVRGSVWRNRLRQPTLPQPLSCPVRARRGRLFTPCLQAMQVPIASCWTSNYWAVFCRFRHIRRPWFTRRSMPCRPATPNAAHARAGCGAIWRVRRPRRPDGRAPTQPLDSCRRFSIQAPKAFFACISVPAGRTPSGCVAPCRACLLPPCRPVPEKKTIPL